MKKALATLIGLSLISNPLHAEEPSLKEVIQKASEDVESRIRGPIILHEGYAMHPYVFNNFIIPLMDEIEGTKETVYQKGRCELVNSQVGGRVIFSPESMIYRHIDLDGTHFLDAREAERVQSYVEDICAQAKGAWKSKYLIMMNVGECLKAENKDKKGCIDKIYTQAKEAATSKKE